MQAEVQVQAEVEVQAEEQANNANNANNEGRVASRLADIRIVLVEPSHPGNIGGVARAMKTMGLGDLALVRPKRFPDPQAVWRAASAVDVLDAARVFDCLDDAIADCGLVAGTSTRSRRIPWPTANAADFAARVADEGLGGKSAAILFGREASGLTNDELQRCNWHVVIPANPAYSSLNLAMAAQVVCYELHKALLAHRVAKPSPAKAPADNWDRPLASAAQMAGFHGQLERLLVAIEFQTADTPHQAMARLRRLFGRLGMDETEVAILRGILTHVERALAKKCTNA